MTRKRVLRSGFLSGAASMAISSLLFVSACTSDRGVSPLEKGEGLPSIMARATVGEARLNIDENGRFALLNENAPDERTAGEAVALANEYSKSLLGHIQTWLERTRGAPISGTKLVACGRPLYAESVFEPVPESEPAGVRNGFGAYWLVTLCAGPEPQVSLAVSALRAGAMLRNGKIFFGDDAGGEFFAYGIPQGHRGEFPLSPEVAAAIAAERTGARVSSTPRLILPMHEDGLPQNAKWSMGLDRPARLRLYGGADVQTNLVAVGADLSERGTEKLVTFVPSSTNPATSVYEYMPRPVGQLHSATARTDTNPVEKLARIKPSLPAKYVQSESRN